ncbi:MAG: SRPBCC family protein [Methylovulum sp.]|nr:SRPBCC family protein [Methylovulum sp.]
MQNINDNGPVTCSDSILINATPEHVWAILTDIGQWANWQNDIKQATLNGPLQAGTSFVWKTGGVTIHSTLHSVEPYSHLGWTGKTMGLYAIHNWSLAEINGQTQVSVAESMEGWLATVFKKAFNKSLATAMRRWLELLKQTCEQ